MSKRAGKASSSDLSETNFSNVEIAETPEPRQDEHKYISEWVRDCTCGVCGQTFEQLNYFLGSKAMGRGESRAVAGFCTWSSEAMSPRPVRFEDRWTPSECPNCEAARRAEEELRQSNAYLSDELPEQITITFELDEAVLVLDSMEELSEAVLANLRAVGKLSIAIGSQLRNLRTALGEEHFTRLLEEGKIVTTEGSN